MLRLKCSQSVSISSWGGGGHIRYFWVHAYQVLYFKQDIVGYHLPFQHNELFHLPYMAVAEISLGRISIRVRPEEPCLNSQFVSKLVEWDDRIFVCWVRFLVAKLLQGEWFFVATCSNLCRQAVVGERISLLRVFESSSPNCCRRTDFVAAWVWIFVAKLL